jgi:predicted DNA-binding ribbon-helix-helix protein
LLTKDIEWRSKDRKNLSADVRLNYLNMLKDKNEKFKPCLDDMISKTRTLEIAYELVAQSLKKPDDK